MHSIKRGFSSIVAITMTILIGILLASAVGLVIKQTSFISLAPALSCTQLNIEPPISIQDIRYNEDTQDLEIIILRSLNPSPLANFEITSRTIDGKIILGRCSQSSICGPCKLPDIGSTKTYFIQGTEIDKAQGVILSVNGCTVQTKSIQI